MAKVRGFLKLQGSMGETTFMKQKNGNNWRSQDKLVISPDRFKSDPKFARVRENATEFTRAAHGGALIRDSISSLVKDVKDKNLSSRMFAKLMEVIKSDVISPRGGGNLVDGNLTLLEGFRFNPAAQLTKVLTPLIATTVDRVTGHMTAVIPVFVPTLELNTPAGATHFQFVSAGIEVDFELGTFKTDIQKGLQQLIQPAPTVALTLTHTLTPNSTHPLLLVFGIRFFALSGAVMSPMLNAATNVLEIVAVSKA